MQEDCFLLTPIQIMEEINKEDRKPLDNCFKNRDVKDLLKPLDSKRQLLICPKCTANFETKAGRRQHIRKCHSNTTCHYCFFECNDGITLKRHIKKNHRSFKCTDCGKTFNTRSSLSQHYGYHHSEVADKLKIDLNKCKNCGEQFKSSRRRTEHILSVHLNRWYPCNICGAKFNRNDSYENHVQGVHGSKQKCKMCDFEGYKDELKEHKLSHVGIKYKSEDSEPFRYSCLKCGKTYARKSDLWEHDQRMHKGVIFPCSQCNLSFIRKPFLRNHIKRIHSKTMCYICNFEVGEDDDEEKIKSHIEKHHSTFKCGECGEISTTKSHLSLHMKLYHVEGRVKLEKQVQSCGECEESFMDKSSLKQHKLSVHFDKWNKCTFCDKIMETRICIRRHEYLVHLKKSCKEKDCDFKGSDSELEKHRQKYHLMHCEYCEFITSSKTLNKLELRNHIRKKHSFPCNLCRFVAKYKKVLKEHMKSHSEEEVACNICGLEMSVSKMEVHILKCKIEQCTKCDFRGSLKEMKNHTQSHVLNCKSCDFKSLDSDVLDRHFRKHLRQAEKKKIKSSLYHCPLCDYKSTEEYFINMHLKNIHKSNGECEENAVNIQETDYHKDKNLEEGSEDEENSQNIENGGKGGIREKNAKDAEVEKRPEDLSCIMLNGLHKSNEECEEKAENIQEKDQHRIPKDKTFQGESEDEENSQNIQNVIKSCSRDNNAKDNEVEKRTEENDKILSMMGTMQNAKWTCKSRNLQIFPVNPKVEQKRKSKKTILHSEVDSPNPELHSVNSVDDSRQIDSTFDETLYQASSIEVKGAVVTQIPDDTEDSGVDSNNPTEKKCSDCGFSTDDEDLFHQHQVTDHLLCYICGFTSQYQVFIFSHMKAIHNVMDFEEEKREEPQRLEKRFKKKPTVCPICSHKSESMNDHGKHISDVHKGQTFKCARCGSRAARFKTILKHYQSFHDQEINSKLVYDESAMN